MKTFQQFRYEKSIFYFIIQRYSVPLTKNLIEKVFPEKIRTRGFHRTDTNGLRKLVKMQGKRATISATRDVRMNNLFGGVETDGGIICVVEGDLFIESNGDLWSYYDTAGRRWIGIEKLPFDNNSLVTKVTNEYNKNVYQLLDRYYPDDMKSHRENNHNAVLRPVLAKELYIKYGQPSNAFLSAYFKMVHKLLQKTPFFSYTSLYSNKNFHMHLGEMILSNIKILEVYARKDVYGFLHKDGMEEKTIRNLLLILKIYNKAKIIKEEDIKNDAEVLPIERYKDLDEIAFSVNRSELLKRIENNY